MKVLVDDIDYGETALNLLMHSISAQNVRHALTLIEMATRFERKAFIQSNRADLVRKVKGIYSRLIELQMYNWEWYHAHVSDSYLSPEAKKMLDEMRILVAEISVIRGALVDMLLDAGIRIASITVLGDEGV